MLPKDAALDEESELVPEEFKVFGEPPLVDKLDEYANLKDVCIGTGKKNDRAWYMGRPREAGDPHGQASMSWICGALMSPRQ